MPQFSTWISINTSDWIENPKNWYTDFISCTYKWSKIFIITVSSWDAIQFIVRFCGSLDWILKIIFRSHRLNSFPPWEATKENGNQSQTTVNFSRSWKTPSMIPQDDGGRGQTDMNITFRIKFSGLPSLSRNNKY